MSPRQPEHCTEMAHVREAIDEIDKQLVDLVAQRFGYAASPVETASVMGTGQRVPLCHGASSR